MRLSRKTVLGTWRGRTATLLALMMAAVLGVAGYLIVESRTVPRPPQQDQLAHLQELVAQNPDNLDLRVQLALYYARNKDYDNAIKEIEQVLSADPEHQDALILLGDIYIDQRRYRDAVEVYDKVIDLNRDNPMRYISMRLEAVYYWKAVAHLNLGEPEKAVESLKEALIIAPTDSDAHYQMGVAYKRLNKTEEAIRSLRMAISYVPDYEEAYRLLAQCYGDMGNEPMKRWAEAMAMYSRGNYKGAADLLNRLILELPDAPEVYLGLGLTYEKLGQKGLAVEAYRNTLELDPDNWLARQRLMALGGEVK